MIGWLHGTVRGNGHDIVVNVGGTGWAVSCVGFHYHGDEIELVVTTVVRENGISLYGFSDSTEQAVFTAMTSVPRVGAQIALSALRTLSVGEIVAAVRDEHPATLSKVPGIGAKMAATLVSMTKLDHIDVEAAPSDPTAAGVIEALIGLGFNAEKARIEVHNLREAGVNDEADLLRNAMAQLR